MSLLLDTNVVSEVRKPRGDATVKRWHEGTALEERHVSVLVLGEVRRRIERIRRSDTRQAAILEAWRDTVRQDYANRILPISGEIAEEWARLTVPDPLPFIDGLMVATARVHDLTFVTRNTAGLERTGVRLLNPWLT